MPGPVRPGPSGEAAEGAAGVPVTGLGWLRLRSARRPARAGGEAVDGCPWARRWHRAGAARGLRGEAVSVLCCPSVRARPAPSPPAVPGVTDGAQGPLPTGEMWPQQVVGHWRVRRLLLVKGKRRRSSVGTRSRIGSG